MAKSKPNSPVNLAALVFVENSVRCVVVRHEGVTLRILDDQPHLERCPAAIIEEYVRAYRLQLLPHHTEIAILARIAHNLRQLEPKPKLP